MIFVLFYEIILSVWNKIRWFSKNIISMILTYDINRIKILMLW
jgi:hypothetical protein